MLRSAARRVLRSALSSIATAACFVSAAECATVRECCATARAVRSIGSVFAGAAMPDNAAIRRRVRAPSALLGGVQPFEDLGAESHHAADQEHAKRRGDAEQEPLQSVLHAGSTDDSAARWNFTTGGTYRLPLKRTAAGNVGFRPRHSW